MDATSANKMDMSHFEFFLVLKNLKTQIWTPISLPCQHPIAPKLVSDEISVLKWIENLVAIFNDKKKKKKKKKQLICRTIINIRLCKLCFSSCRIFQLLVYLLFRRNGLGQVLYQFFSKLVSVRNWIHYYIILFGK